MRKLNNGTIQLTKSEKIDLLKVVSAKVQSKNLDFNILVSLLNATRSTGYIKKDYEYYNVVVEVLSEVM